MGARGIVEARDLASWFAGSKVVNPDGTPRLVYHGTREQFRNFSKVKAAMGGITWFTSDKASTAEYGPIVVPLYARLLKPAGWAEYQRLGLWELRREGYDGAILPKGGGHFDGFAFEPSSLRRAPVQESPEGRMTDLGRSYAGLPRKFWMSPAGKIEDAWGSLDAKGVTHTSVAGKLLKASGSKRIYGGAIDLGNAGWLRGVVTHGAIYVTQGFANRPCKVGREQRAKLEDLALEHGLRVVDDNGARERVVFEPPERMAESDADHADAMAETGRWGRRGAGCVIVSSETGRILMPLRSGTVNEPGTWGTWGGAIDGGESAKAAAAREASEESGAPEALSVEPLLVHREPGFAYHNFLYVVGPEFQPALNDETIKAEWVAFGAWPRPLHPGLAALLHDAASAAKIRGVARSAVAEAVTHAGMSSKPGGFDAGGYRIDGFKYWIAPDGEAHSCKDHSDWAEEEFNLPSDEGDGEKAGENIEAAQERGYADVHTEREAGTREEFVYVRVPWAKLTKAQREAIKSIAERRAASVVDDSGAKAVEVYSARGLRTD